ncbi:MAG: cysteine desulfurase [Oscillospiraceae bacterium]|nr:cysteine desulfurase [Oscillospiraceae bacterium]
MDEIYLDNAATTHVSHTAAQAVLSAMTDCWGNPSSLHKKGLQAKLAFEKAAADIAAAIGAKAENIIFTSGGTEADNLAIIGGALAKRRRGNRIVTTAIEHSAVLAACSYLEEQGFEVVRLIPDSFGRYTAEQIADAVNEKTVLVSMMLVNNEVGSVLPVGRAAKLIRRKNPETLIHCDAVQAFGKMPIKVGSALDVDLLSVSGHKIHAPKGIGALYIKKGVRILPLSHGGSQQKGLRTGTEPLPLAVGMAAAAAEAVKNLAAKQQHFEQLRTRLLENVSDMFDVCINSAPDSAPYIVNLSVVGVRSEIMLHFLESKGIYLSSGSACSKGQKSHVLTSMGLSPEVIDSALRISFDDTTTIEQIDIFSQALHEGAAAIRRR